MGVLSILPEYSLVSNETLEIKINFGLNVIKNKSLGIIVRSEQKISTESKNHVYFSVSITITLITIITTSILYVY